MNIESSDHLPVGELCHSLGGADVGLVLRDAGEDGQLVRLLGLDCYINVYLFIYLSIYLSIYTCIYLYNHQFTICLSTSLSIFLVIDYDPMNKNGLVDLLVSLEGT